MSQIYKLRALAFSLGPLKVPGLPRQASFVGAGSHVVLLFLIFLLSAPVAIVGLENKRQDKMSYGDGSLPGDDLKYLEFDALVELIT